MAERISRRKVLSLAVAGIGAVVAGALGARELLSSGNGEGKAAVVKSPTAEPTNKPPATETIAPTATVEPTPSPEPTRFVPKKLSEAEYVPTNYQTVLESLTGENGALELHPDYNKIYYSTNEVPLSREHFMNNLEFLGSGNPTEGLIGGSNLVTIAFYVYAEKEYQEFYDVAVKATNYFLTQYPENKAKFDEFLSQEIQQTSPPLEK